MKALELALGLVLFFVSAKGFAFGMTDEDRRQSLHRAVEAFEQQRERCAGTAAINEQMREDYQNQIVIGLIARAAHVSVSQIEQHPHSRPEFIVRGGAIVCNAEAAGNSSSIACDKWNGRNGYVESFTIPASRVSRALAHTVDYMLAHGNQCE